MREGVYGMCRQQAGSVAVGMAATPPIFADEALSSGQHEVARTRPTSSGLNLASAVIWQPAAEPD